MIYNLSRVRKTTRRCDVSSRIWRNIREITNHRRGRMWKKIDRTTPTHEKSSRNPTTVGCSWGKKEYSKLTKVKVFFFSFFCFRRFEANSPSNRRWALIVVNDKILDSRCRTVGQIENPKPSRASKRFWI